MHSIVCVLARQLTVAEAFACRRTDRDGQSAHCFQLSEHLLLELRDLFLERWNLDQVVAFVGIGLQIIKSVLIPHAVVVDALVSIGANRE